MLAIPLTSLLALLGCRGEPTTGFPDFTGPSRTEHLQLHLLAPHDLELGRPALPPSSEPPDEFVLAHEEVPNPQGAPRKLRVLRAPLPFPLTKQDVRFAPVGMRVLVEGAEVPYARGKAAHAAEPTWRVHGKHLVLSYPTVPPAGSVRVVYPGVQRKLDRHDPDAAGLRPADFIRSDVTLGTHTRHGLMLPAPSKATWSLTLPRSAPRFEAWLALEPPPLSTPPSDGADAVLSITADGQTVEVAREALSPGQSGFQRWHVDLSAFAGQPVDLTLETRPREHNHFDWVFLGSPSVWGEPDGPPRRVVIVAMDTTRPDRFGHNGYPRGTTPRMDRIASQSVTFDRTWATAPRTRPSFRSATTGRLPLNAVGATNISEVFQRNGFATAGFVANVHLQPRFDFDHGYDSWWYDGQADAVHQVDRALDWLRDNEDRDTFLFVHFMDPHLPYRAPDGYELRFVDQEDPDLPEHFNRWEVNRWSQRGGVTEVRKQHISGLYDGEMAYMDHHLGRLFDALDHMPGETLAILYSDHGEEFWEHGGFEHNHTLFDEVTRAVLWFRPGGGLSPGRRIDSPASLLDIGPTLYDLFGFTDLPDTDGRSLRPILEQSAPLPERPLPVGYLQYDTERWGVVFQDHKYILHTGTGQEELYDLHNDPGETRNLAGEIDLKPWRRALAEAHQVPVQPGWRVQLDLRGSGFGALEFGLPQPAEGAGVLDPEATIPNRANLEWGEPPRRTAGEIGKIALAEDRRSFVLTVGPNPDGVLWVQFPGPVPVGEVQVHAVTGDQRDLLPLSHADGAATWSGEDARLTITAGPVLVPPPGEAARMAALRGAEDADPDAIQLLKELGYIH